MNIIELKAENVKKIKAVSIEPGGKPIVKISGKNGAGKSSVLDSIQYALGGKTLQCDRPVRDG